MTTITPQELMKRFSEVKGSKILTVVMNTEVKLLKNNRDTKEPCPYQGVRKTTRCKVMLGTDYESGVNNTRGREGKEETFEAQKHSWAEHTDKPTISTSKDGSKIYANLRLLKTYEVEYTADGKVTPKEELENYMPKERPPQNQGIDKPVEWRMPHLMPDCSIKSYKSDGVEVQVKEPSCES